MITPGEGSVPFENNNHIVTGIGGVCLFCAILLEAAAGGLGHGRRAALDSNEVMHLLLLWLLELMLYAHIVHKWASIGQLSTQMSDYYAAFETHRSSDCLNIYVQCGLYGGCSQHASRRVYFLYRPWNGFR